MADRYKNPTLQSDGSNAYWSAQELDDLRRLHAKGLTFTQIAAAMGRNKNQIVGKVRRLGLPIRCEANGRPLYGPPTREQYLKRQKDIRAKEREKARNKAVRPYIYAPMTQKVTPSPIPVRLVSKVAQSPHASLTVIERPREEPTTRPVRITGPCCWPIGEPRTPGFRYCDADTFDGSVYCPDHRSIAYRAPVDLRERKPILDAAD